MPIKRFMLLISSLGELIEGQILQVLNINDRAYIHHIVQSVTLGYMHFAIVRQSEEFFKKHY